MRSHETPSLWRAWPASGGLSPKGIERSRGDEGHPLWIDLTRSVAPLLWLKQICLVKAETKTMKAMKTPAAKAKGMKPETKTMKVMKIPAAKAKGMKPETKTMKVMKASAAKARGMKPKTEPVKEVKVSTVKGEITEKRGVLGSHDLCGPESARKRKGGEITEDELLALLE